MRNVNRALSFLGLLTLSATLQAASCANTAEDCALIGTSCTGQPLPTTSSSSGDPDGGAPLCEQSPRDNPASVDDMCGVFVKSSAMVGGDGSMASPLPSLKQGIDAAIAQKKKRVYVCLGSYTELLTVPAGMTLYGGLDCAKDWEVTDTNSTLKGVPDKIPLTLDTGAEPTRIESFDVVAVNAAQPGGNSIAALARAGSTVHFTNSKLTAGDGQKGSDGQSTNDTPLSPPAKSLSGVKACTSMSTNDGGAQNANACDPPENPDILEFSIGGSGGDGNVFNGSAGSTGLSSPPAMTPAGQGGNGQASCAGGGDGAPGASGTDGVAGAGGIGQGTLVTDVGWTGASGGDGTKGTPGQGGGGGGGQAGKMSSAGKPKVCAGASGGAGGAGGCGGLGGKGGKSGGSSIGLVSLSATITFVNVTIVTGKGGAGGVGGMYQSGAMGGAGGDGGAGDNPDAVVLPPGCKGGLGGNGGNGGPGGGGAGGHTLGIAYVGQMPTADKLTFMVPPDGFGAGGLGGDGGSQNNSGGLGESKSTLEFKPGT